MQQMEFLQRTLFNTDTMATVNTGTVSLMIDRKNIIFSASMATTTASTFTADVVLGQDANRIIIQECNWKNFSIQINGADLSLTSAVEATSTASWTGNSATSLYLSFPTTTVNTMSVIVNSNTASTLVHTVENLFVNNLQYAMERNPAARDFRPREKRTEFVHKLSDGGSVQYVLGIVTGKPCLN